jgi:hypothetical protein
MGEDKSRDRQGRWVKGVSGNRKGRPPKLARLDHGDLQTFKNTAMEVNTPDGLVLMTREAAVLHRLYQAAMKGNVHAQIFLSRRFEKHAESKAAVAAELHRIISKIKEGKRAPTDYEMALIEAALMHLGARPWPEEEPPKVRLSRTRRRTPQRRGSDSDAGPDR